MNKNQVKQIKKCLVILGMFLKSFKKDFNQKKIKLKNLQQVIKENIFRLYTIFIKN